MGYVVQVLVGALGIVIANLAIRMIETYWPPRTPDKGGKRMASGRRLLGAKPRVLWMVGGAVLSLALFNGVRILAGASAIKAPFCTEGYFYPSGWMGDGETGSKQIQLNDQWKENCHSAPTCLQFMYEPGTKGWAGVYWQYPDGNWGDKAGRAIEGAARLVIWARGQNGGEVLEFKTGGIKNQDKKYHDSFEKTIGTVGLTTEWKRFEIDLNGVDTSSVLGAFAWIANQNGNPSGLTFYLDDICFE
jgi:hypothetical protein